MRCSPQKHAYVPGCLLALALAPQELEVAWPRGQQSKHLSSRMQAQVWSDLTHRLSGEVGEALQLVHR